VSPAGNLADASSPGAGLAAPGEIDAVLRIGAVAEATGVSERTLRYYEELGLITPALRRPGCSRSYRGEDVARVQRIRELQDLMGLDLDEIRTVIAAEDQLAALRTRYRASSEAAEQVATIEEAAATVTALRERVGHRLERLASFLAELDAKLERYAGLLETLHDAEHVG
jgi:DNA-binding transcriptional MerR regulator